MSQNSVLIVDDEKDISGLIADILKDCGYKATTAKNSAETFDRLAENSFEAIILDIWLKDSELDGLSILEFTKRKYPEIPVIMISGHGNIETAVRSLKLGAFDYIEKPFKEDKLINVTNKAVEFSRLIKENKQLKNQNKSFDFLNGNSLAVKNIKLEIEKISKTESRIFLNGGIGSGKEAIAQNIHDLSKRASNPFVKLELNNYNEKHIDGIIFGTEDGGDLNSPARKIGLLEIADQGTLYINEICDIPKETQKKLVKFLTDGKFIREGGKREIAANVRIISSTNRNLERKIKEGEFRSDLYHRMNVVELNIPSLAERREDIPLLIEELNLHYSRKYNFPVREFTNEAVIALQSYKWPGNIRQLMNVVEWMLITNIGDKNEKIKSSMLPKEITSNATDDVVDQSNKELMSLKLREARQVFEKHYLLAQINRFGGNISRTATFVGMERSALHRKLKSLQLAKGEELLDAPDVKERRKSA